MTTTKEAANNLYYIFAILIWEAKLMKASLRGEDIESLRNERPRYLDYDLTEEIIDWGEDKEGK